MTNPVTGVVDPVTGVGTDNPVTGPVQAEAPVTRTRVGFCDPVTGVGPVAGTSGEETGGDGPVTGVGRHPSSTTPDRREKDEIDLYSEPSSHLACARLLLFQTPNPKTSPCPLLKGQALRRKSGESGQSCFHPQVGTGDRASAIAFRLLLDLARGVEDPNCEYIGGDGLGRRPGRNGFRDPSSATWRPGRL